MTVRYISTTLVYWVSVAAERCISFVGTQLDNAERPYCRRVTNGRIILWRRLCMQRSTGRYLNSWCNRVYLLFCSLDIIPLWSSFQVVSRLSRPAALLFFRYFSALSISSRSANRFHLHHLLRRLGRVVGPVPHLYSNVVQVHSKVAS
jgi:hypothetical protein